MDLLTDDSNLAWFFGGEAAAALGLRSSHAAFEHACLVGPGQGSGQPGDHVTDRQLEAAERHRRIATALGRCSRETQRVLAAHHGPLNLRRVPEVGIVFGRLAALALRTARRLGIDLPDVAAVFHTKAPKDRLEAAARSVLRVRTEATRELAKALEDYRQSSPRRRVAAP